MRKFEGTLGTVTASADKEGEITVQVKVYLDVDAAVLAKWAGQPCELALPQLSLEDAMNGLGGNVVVVDGADDELVEAGVGGHR